MTKRSGVTGKEKNYGSAEIADLQKRRRAFLSGVKRKRCDGIEVQR